MLGTLAFALIAIQQPSTLPSDGIKFSTKVVKTVSLNYLARVPEDYAKDSGKRWPLMIFLHGSGERGSDLNVVRVHGPFAEMAKGRKLPFVVIAPQAEDRTNWDTDALHNMLRDVMKRYRVDRDRIYLTGLSMGGYGTWAWACAEPNVFAAIAPICGGGKPLEAAKLRSIPTWVRHGDADQAVPLKQSVDMVDALKAVGGDVKFDIVLGGQHDVWTAFYSDPAVYEWFLSKHRN